MILSIELTDTEYVAVMHALRNISRTRTVTQLCVLSEAQQLELEHLRTLLAEAAAPPKPKPDVRRTSHNYMWLHHDQGGPMRTVIRGTIQPADDDRLCDECEDQPAVMEGIEHAETSLTPAEWFALCDVCGDGRAVGL